MSGYTLDHIIDECVREKSKNVAPNSKEGIYVEAWSALNTWLDALLTKKRGGNINLLGAFTWEIKTDADGSRNMRPLFLMMAPTTPPRVLLTFKLNMGKAPPLPLLPSIFNRN